RSTDALALSAILIKIGRHDYAKRVADSREDNEDPRWQLVRGMLNERDGLLENALNHYVGALTAGGCEELALSRILALATKTPAQEFLLKALDDIPTSIRD